MKRTVNLRDMSASSVPGQDNSSGTRKILQDLQQEKKRLRLLNQGVVPGPTPNPLRLPLNPPGTINQQGDPMQHLQQRNPLQVAQASSFGYFIHQDSAFGNVILPVIPRLGPNFE